MGGNEKALRDLFQENFKKIAGIEPKNGTPVRANVADGGQGGIEALHGFKIRGIEEIMYLSNLAAPFIDRADLGAEDKTDLCRRSGGVDPLRHEFLPITGGIGFQPKKSGFSRFEMLMELGKPARMGEIASPHDLNTLDCRPGSKPVEVAGLTRGPRIKGMDVEIRNIFHEGDRQPYRWCC